MRQPGQKAVTGRVASHTRHRLVPTGRTTRPVRPLEFNDSDRKRGVIMREFASLPFADLVGDQIIHFLRQPQPPVIKVGHRDVVDG
jgi:hypothetical protein